MSLVLEVSSELGKLSAVSLQDILRTAKWPVLKVHILVETVPIV